MKFYDCSTAPSPRRVRIFIAEKRLEIDTVEVDLRHGEQLGDAFRAINPDCTVPVLQLDDGTVVTEVLAVCHYLEEYSPEPALIGTTAEERATALMWNAKVEQQGLMAVAEAFRNSAKGFKERALPGQANYAQIPELAERGRVRLQHFFRRIDAQLSENEFLAGEYYSIADISALVAIDFAGWLKMAIPADARNVQRWYDSVSARPSAAV